MKLFSILLFTLLYSSVSWGQSLRQANSLFEKYEYSRASEIYTEYSKSRRLSFEDYQKLAYCYFITGEYSKSAKLSDSLVSRADVDPYFHFVNGQSNMALGNYEQAKAAFKRYKKSSGEHDVESKIKALESIQNWEDITHVENGLFGSNSTKADMNGAIYSFGAIEFHEVGEDSSGNFINADLIDASELLLSRPFVRSKSGELSPIQFEKKFRDAVVSSFALDESTGEVWLTIAQPLKKKKLNKAPHIYYGKFDFVSRSVTSLVPWSYSGIEDFSSTAHATLNESKNTLVFSKLTTQKKDADLFVSRKVNNKWSQPEIITTISTSGDDLYPLFMGDTMLSFSSDGHLGYGGLDIYTSRINGAIFEEVTHIKAPINSFADDFNFLRISQDSALYSSNRNNGIGDDDQYLLVYSRPVPVEVIDTVYEEFVAEWETPIIYFEYNKAAIINVKKLDELIVFMETYPESTLLVEGHSDSRGRESYNYKLALSRAESVRLELGKKGLNLDQISVESKGSTDPQVDCKQNCSEEDHAKNRFARIILIAK